MIATATSSGMANSILNRNDEEQDKISRQLSTALRINQAADDAAGLQISSRLTSEINADNQLNYNVQDQANINSVTEGQLNSVTESLQRAQELSIQSGSPLADQNAIQQELDQLTEEINTVAESALGSSGFISGLDASDPAATQDALNAALDNVNQNRSALGAENNSLASQSTTYSISAETLSASRSRIQDTDFAQASSEEERLNVLQQATIQMKRDEEERKGVLINSFI